MPQSEPGPIPVEKVSKLYEERFRAQGAYRAGVWQRLVRGFFQQYVRADDTLVDLGAGYCEFINQVSAGKKIALDMNPATRGCAAAGVEVLDFDVTAQWQLAGNSADVVFTSNFFEHLESKAALTRCMAEIHRVLRPGGRLIAMGPNIRFCARQYWDFYDHYIPLSDRSMKELLVAQGFTIERLEERFLPYTMSQGSAAPLPLVSAYLRMPLAWKLFGKQFLVVARKPE